MIAARSEHAAVAVNGTILVVGGCNELGALASVEQFNPATNQWTAREPLAEARQCPALAASGGTIYVIGGVNGETPIPSVVSYDLATGRLTTLTTLPRVRHNLSAIVDGSRLVVFGRPEEGGRIAIAEVFDRESQAWSTLPGVAVRWGRRPLCGR